MLPPRPDPQTGLPRPPEAPTWESDEKASDWSVRAPRPPRGRGPTLEWTRPNLVRDINAFLGCAAFIFFHTFLLAVGIHGIDTELLTSQGMWIYTLVASFLATAFHHVLFAVSAGSDWVAYAFRWVETYELVDVRIEEDDTLILKDRRGRRVMVAMEYATRNPRLWDLVYNGIRHSVYHGTATVDVAPWNTLWLDAPILLDPDEADRLRWHSPDEQDRSFASPPRRPDPETGRPRPGRAPDVPNLPFAPRWRTARSVRRRTDCVGSVPEPPLGEGPTLEWVGRSPRTLLRIAVVSFLTIVGLGSVGTGGVDWLGELWVWALTATQSWVAALLLWPRSDRAAGADWFRYNDAWVRLYRLSDVRLRRRWNGHRLDLTDTRGHRVRIMTSRLQENRELWALVYNGILHWAYREGPDTDPYTSLQLRLTPVTVAGEDGRPDA